MKSHGFEEINHTADLALRVWGEDFQDLLKQAARGLYYLLNANRQDGAPIKVCFSIVKDTREAMLVDFLNELLFLCESKKRIFHSFSFTEEENTLNVDARGDKLEYLARNIKAVTFHDLDIKEKPTGLETTVTFDV